MKRYISFGLQVVLPLLMFGLLIFGRGVGFFPFFLMLFLFLDYYVLGSFLSLCKSSRGKWILSTLYVLIMAFSIYGLYQGMTGWKVGTINWTFWPNFIMGLACVIIMTKIIFAALMYFQDLGRLGVFIKNFVPGSRDNAEESPIPSRRKFLTWTALGMTGIPFLTFMHGITRGKYSYNMSRTSLSFDDLPSTFDGYKIVQISDIHAGSLDSKECIEYGVELINKEKPDIILFTGDLVNVELKEIDIYQEIFSKLDAKDGKFAVLGNHDYWDLDDWDDKASSEKLITNFADKFDEMGFRLLNNEYQSISRGDESIKIVGVENWGKGRWFPKRGDLDAALKESGDNDDFIVLMSHDPTHWDEVVIPHYKKIHLTLSGHTHGMQFGLNLPWLKWSPAQYRYPRWMGLYTENKQHLYVNRGFGFLGFPGRIGIYPEISVIELKATV